MKTIIAIDPGASGGIAQWYDGQILAYPIPQTEGDLIDTLRVTRAAHPYLVAYIEKVGGFAGQGQPGSRMFTFGRGVGFIVGALMALSIPIREEVMPRTWQKALGLGHKPTDGPDWRNKMDWKNKAKAKAQQLFPTVEVTLKTSDALCILEYARQKESMFHQS